ncbi:MAG: hypothetical protein HY083_04395, partial [Gammaproteobacteria bacterium]|nr:hypothetical protein [Gammaproteobacteria bacterium]
MAIWIVWLKKPVGNKMWALLTLLIGTVATAQELPQASPVPGGIAIVPLVPDTEPAPVVHFANQRVMVIPRDG